MLSYFLSFFHSENSDNDLNTNDSNHTHQMITRSQTNSSPIQLVITSNEENNDSKTSINDLKSFIDEEYFNFESDINKDEYYLPIKKRREKLESYLHVNKRPYNTRSTNKNQNDDIISINSHDTIVTDITFDCFNVNHSHKNGYNLRNRKPRKH